MLRRREFLKHSVVIAGVASTGILGGHASAQVARTRVDFVLLDEDFEDSVAFARELASQGATAFPIEQDIGQLWFGDLGRAFAAGKVIAGLTSHSELLVCAAFARTHGARVRYEGAHDCRGSDVLTHSLRTTNAEVPFGASLAAAGTNWPSALAACLSDLTLSEGALHEHCCRTTTPRSASHPGSLFSWVIA